MKAMTLRTGLLAAGAALIAIASAQVTQSGTAYTLKMKWAKGKSYAYGITYTMTVGKQATPTKASYSMVVKDVKNGVATVEAKANVPGLSNGDAQTFKIDSNGKVVGGTTNVSMTTLPGKAIKVGEKWTSSRDLTQPMKMTLKSTYTLKGLKVVNGKKYAEITEVMAGSAPITGSSGTITMNGTGTILLDVAEGMLFKYTNTAKLVMKSGKDTQTIPVTSVVTRTK
jgi:hypothetical protein